MNIINGLGKIAYSLGQKIEKKLIPNKGYWNVYAPVIKVLENVQLAQTMVKDMFEKMPFKETDIVLDAGCGNGAWIKLFAEKVAEVHAIDVAPNMIKEAKKNLEYLNCANIGYKVMDLENGLTGYKNESFDKIINVLVFGYLKNQDNLLQEFHRTLKTEGELGIITPIKGAKFKKIMNVELQKKKEEKRLLTLETIKNLPLGIIAVNFGKMAELKDYLNNFQFNDPHYLKKRLEDIGFDIIDYKMVYADQAIQIVARKK